MTIGYFLHCDFVDAGNGLMSHHPVKKIEAKHMVGKCQESMVRVFFFPRLVKICCEIEKIANEGQFHSTICQLFVNRKCFIEKSS